MRKTMLMSMAAVLVVLLAFGGLAGAAHDFEGATVRLLLDKSSTRAWFHDTTENIWSTPVVEGHIEAIEEQFNVNLELVEGSWDVDLMAASILAGDPMADVLMLENEDLLALVNANMIYPLTDVLDSGDFGSYPTYFEENWDWFSYFGEIYAVPKKELPVSADVIFFNRTLIEREGLADPHELWQNGQWTWEAFRELAESAEADTTGDGEIDQIGVVSGDRPDTWIWANDADWMREEDGRMVITFDEPAFVEAVEFARDMRNADLFHGGGRSRFLEGTAAMRVGGAWEAGVYAIDVEEMPFEWAIVPFPKGPSAEAHRSAFRRVMGFSFPITTENVEAMLELTNAIFFLTDKYEPESAWVDDRLHGYVRAGSPDRTSYEAYAFAVDNMQRTLHIDFMRGEMRNIVRGDADIASALDAYKPEAQAELDSMFGQ